MRRLLLIFLMIHSVVVMAQDEDCVGAVVKLMGVTELEEVDSYEVERLSEYFYNPININRASVADLEKSGLFTYYQIVSLTDYRSRHGDVLSFTELSAVDGFTDTMVKALSPFVSLACGKVVVELSQGAANQELAIKGGYKSDDSDTYMYGLKYRLNSEHLLLGLSASRPYNHIVHYPSAYSGNITWNYGRGKLVAGDFNARFGQGLCLWNSAVFSSLSLPSAYMRKPTGVASTNSFTGSSALTGLAADICAGKWKVSAVLAMPGVKELKNLSFIPAVNVARYGSYGVLSVTHMMQFTDVFSPFYRIPQMKTSADVSMCFNGVNVFGETAFDWVNKTVAAVCGTDFMATERLRIAVLLKCYPSKGFSNDYGTAASGEVSFGRVTGNFSLESSYYPQPKSKDVEVCCQAKLQTEWSYMLTDNFLIELRVKERLRTWGFLNRTDVRIGVQYKTDMASVVSRFNVLSCDKTAMLGYIEGGYTPGKISTFLRLGLFKVDDWDDRIYVYERDAPGNFNVPAFYGRGLWTSAYLASKPERWLRLYLRASYISYMFMPIEIRKPGRAELKFQCLFRF